MRHLQISLLLCVVVFATGCPKPKYRPSVSFDQGMVDKFNAALKRQYRDYECSRFGPTHIDFQGTACTGFTQDLNKAKDVRNELLENALPYIDESYLDFITAMQAGRDRNNFVLDLVELGTAASVGITKGERPLQIIGVALTAFRGGRRSIDANFYKDQSTPILISKMDGNRAKVRATILSREKGSVEDYSLGAAVADLVDYYNAGTLVRAFTELQKDTAIKTNESEENVLVLKGVLTPEATLDSRNLSVAASDLLQVDLFTQLNDPTQKAAATARLQKIVETLEKDKDAAAALKNASVSSNDTDGVKLRKALIDIRRAAALVNNTALLSTINRAIVDTPVPATSPTSTPTPTPTPTQ